MKLRRIRGLINIVCDVWKEQTIPKGTITLDLAPHHSKD